MIIKRRNEIIKNVVYDFYQQHYYLDTTYLEIYQSYKKAKGNYLFSE